MSTEQIRLSLGLVPALLSFQKSPEKAAMKGTILFYHGLGACKEAQLTELTSLAREGFLAVGIDNCGHGDRQLPYFDQYFSSENARSDENFQRLLEATIDEIPLVIDSLLNYGFAHPQRIGVCGISMGGYIAWAAPLIDQRISTAVPILGSPEWKEASKSSPHLQPDKFYPTALLAQNAGRDTNVPAEKARQFCQSLEEHYRQAPERLRYIEFSDAEHFMSEEKWNQLWENTLEWFSTYLTTIA